MGLVYEAVQESLGRRVAVKLLDARLSDDREQLERFRREAEVVAALGHPNIVQVTDFQYPDEPGQQPFLVMELLRGSSLGAVVEHEGALPAARVAFVAAQVLSALVAAHRAGVVHRDIKPDNIFLLADAAVPDTVKVLDFGIAKLSIEGQAKLTGTGAMLGTPAFMAPEQARGEGDVDARADVYAVGATMYQALTGRLPYEAASIPALLFAIVEKTPPPLAELRPDLPSDFVAVVERAMAKDRAARFADADAMRRALAPWSGLPASIPPPISATAATVSSGPIAPRDPQTPIVVHRTPAPASAVAPPPREKSGPSTLLLLTVLLLAGMAMTVAIIWIVHSGKSAATASPPPSVASPPPVAAASSAAPVTSVATIEHVTTPSATSALSASAAPVVTKRRRWGGKDGYVSSSDFELCDCDWEAFHNDLGMRAPAISACFASTQYDPPLHEVDYYEFAVSPAGEITVKKNDGTLPKLDRCLTSIVRSVPIKMKTGKGGSFKLSFRGECTPGWGNHCVD